jgi:hypothetical protein
MYRRKKMQTKTILLILGISMLGLLFVIPHTNASTNNIYFQDSSLHGGTVIYVDNISFNNNVTSEIYNDDLSTIRTLENLYQTSSTWRANLGTWITMSYPLSPMDSTAFNSSKFYFYISNVTGLFVTATFKFDITTLNNNTRFNRSITFTTAGKKLILTGNEMCSSCYRYTCTAYTTLSTGGLRIRINQSRWGVISKYNNDYYIRNAGIEFYSNFGETGKRITITNNNIYFNLNSSFNNYIFNVAGQNDITMKNVSFYVNDESSLYNKNKWFTSNGKNWNISRCYFYSNFSNEFNMGFSTHLNITDSLFNNVGINLATFENINNTIFTNTGKESQKHYFKFYSGKNFKNCIFSNSKYGFYTYSTIHNYNVSDCLFNNIEYVLFPNSQTQNVHLINCTSNTWGIDTSSLYPFLTGQTYRDYTLELRVMNGTIPISSANIKIYNKNNVLKYSGTTNINGYIPKQILPYCVWNVTYTYPPYVFSPYVINITKTGFRNINYNVNNSVKLNLTVPMIQNETCSITDITLYENFDNATGTHEYKLNSTGYHVYANVTGNTSFIPLNNFTVGLNFTGVHINITWTGDYSSNNTNISFKVDKNMTLNGNVSVNGKYGIFIEGIVSIMLDNFTFILTYLFVLMYFIFNNKTNQLFIQSKIHYIFILSTLVMLFGIEAGAFFGYGFTDPIQRAILTPFILMFIALLWLTRIKPENK